jgi:collagen triple helix repeat protein
VRGDSHRHARLSEGEIKTMFNRIHQKLGTAGFIISIVALVAALGGGAYAASGTSTGKATASAKAKQGKQGKQGKPGKTGPAGPAGAQGPVGPAGPKGDTGAAGANGSNGATGARGATGPTGVTGATGVSGFTETLPAGKTETGTWTISQNSSRFVFPEFPSAISFPIPLKEAGEAFAFGKAETAAEEYGTSRCAGNGEDPTAPPGTLCVYTLQEDLFEAGGAIEALVPSPGGTTSAGFGPSGSWIAGIALTGNAAHADLAGTWAVTAPVDAP